MKLNKPQGLAIIVLIACAVVGFAFVSLTGVANTGPDTSTITGTSASTSTSTSTSTSNNAAATGEQQPPSGLPSCDINDLPATALSVIEDIEAGGPFDYPRNDDGTFGNYEGLLPSESNGYYREYTVETPGLDHRGARRIVTGGDVSEDPDYWFFTEDHYESFCDFTASL
ncbi:hypothetical protein K0651_06975 [Ornithinimicrobium sp. Arc0846-15]|nr:hypothetical protein [Ornithinimicrobium laminariae]